MAHNLPELSWLIALLNHLWLAWIGLFKLLKLSNVVLSSRDVGCFVGGNLIALPDEELSARWTLDDKDSSRIEFLRLLALE